MKRSRDEYENNNETSDIESMIAEEGVTGLSQPLSETATTVSLQTSSMDNQNDDNANLDADFPNIPEYPSNSPYANPELHTHENGTRVFDAENENPILSNGIDAWFINNDEINDDNNNATSDNESMSPLQLNTTVLNINIQPTLTLSNNNIAAFGQQHSSLSAYSSPNSNTSRIPDIMDGASEIPINMDNEQSNSPASYNTGTQVDDPWIFWNTVDLNTPNEINHSSSINNHLENGVNANPPTRYYINHQETHNFIDTNSSTNNPNNSINVNLSAMSNNNIVPRTQTPLFNQQRNREGHNSSSARSESSHIAATLNHSEPKAKRKLSYTE